MPDKKYKRAYALNVTDDWYLPDVNVSKKVLSVLKPKFD